MRRKTKGLKRENHKSWLKRIGDFWLNIYFSQEQRKQAFFVGLDKNYME